MSRVSIAAGQKPKPKESFKFLRRDEGRLSYGVAVSESPSKGGIPTPRVNSERRDSRALREAIAHDMKNAKSHDPFGEVVIAVPKRAPPPNAAAVVPDSGSGAPPKRVPGPRAAPRQSRPEWVGTATPPRRDDAEAPAGQREPRSPGGYEAAYQESTPPGPIRGVADGAGAYQPYSDRGGPAVPAPVGNGRRGHPEDNDEERYGGGGGGAPPAVPPRRVGSAPRRYVDPAFDDYDRNYFRRAPPPANLDYSPAPPVGRGRAEEDLMLQLEQEVRAAQEERARYTHAQQQLDREKQRFESFRYTTQQQLDEERAELDSLRMKEHRSAQKDVKALEERYRSVSGLLSTEREANRKLMGENDSLRHQLEELTATLREQQKVHKVETARLRRDVESLTARNADLLAMAKEQQIHQMDAVAASRSQPRSAPASAASSVPREVSAPRQPSVLTPPQPKQQQVQQVQERPPRSEPSPPPATAPSESSSHDDHDDDGASDAESAGSRSNGERRAPVVMDFTPWTKADAAHERRAREVEEHLQRGEDEAQRRREQRERDAAVRRALEVAAQQQQQQQQQPVRDVVEKRRPQTASEKTAAKTREKDTSPPPEEAAAARKAAGHPLRTPRGPAVSGGPSTRTAAAVGAKKAGVTPASGASSAAPPAAGRRTSQQVSPAVQAVAAAEANRKSMRIPTREELLGDSESMPPEDFENDEIVSQTVLGDNPNKREIHYRSGKRQLNYANGTRKVMLPSGHTILHFTNGDVKCTFPSGKSTYWYDAAQTTHTQNPDGVQVFEFNSTGQTERHQTDGTKEILYPDGIFKIVRPDGTDETFFPEDS